MEKTFKLNDIETNRAEEFIQYHCKKCGKSTTTIGGMYTYEITPTGVGLFIKIRCNQCHESLDITDIDTM